MSEAAQRIEKRLAELNRSMIEDNNIAQPASRIPVKEPTSPSVDGDRDVSSVAKLRQIVDLAMRDSPKNVKNSKNNNRRKGKEPPLETKTQENGRKSIETQNFFTNSFRISKQLPIFADEMRIVSHRRLVEFYSSEGHGDSQTALERWYDIAENAEWKNLSDIKVDFPATDYVGNQHYVFNIRGNKYRLVVVVKFMIGHVFIRFVGTHSEYDRIDASTI